MRGQAHTLEAVVASLLLLASLTFALQMTVVTPLSASTSSQHIENQQAATANGVLAAAAEEGALKEAVLYWNDSTARFNNASNNGRYAGQMPNNTFGRMLNRSFISRSIVVNVYVTYENSNGALARQPMIYSGQPSDNAVAASRTVTLVDDDHLVHWNETESDVSVKESDTYFAPDRGTGGDNTNAEGGVYSVVEVEVISWRI
jgi:hypothetical protein